jgi:predicted dehydrogenase
MSSTDLSRRALLAASAASAGRVLGANDRIRYALIGCGNRGVHSNMRCAIALGAQCVALADVFKPAIEQAREQLGAAAAGVESYSDYRRVLERKDVDVVFVATPDHWHVPITADACAAGKDVFVEKPVSNSIPECLSLVDVVRRTGRVVQVGLQQRSMKVYRDALGLIEAGAIGKVHRAIMTWGGNAPVVPRSGDEVTDPPPDLDWPGFQGRAPRRPYRRTRQRSWRWYPEYGCGSLTDLGVHVMDVTRWFLRAGHPISCSGIGLRTAARFSEQVPDVAEMAWKFDNFVATFATRDEMMNHFYGDLGVVSVNRSLLRTTLYKGRGVRPEVKETRVVDPGFEKLTPRVSAGEASHVTNFFDCVRSRKKPNADVEAAGQSTIVCLLAARSVATGKAYGWDGRKAKEL